MQFQDLRHSGSYQALPAYPPPQINMHLDSNCQQQLQAQLRRERANMANLDLPPRPRQYPLQLKEVYYQPPLNTPLAFNLNSPNKFKLKKTNNRPPTRANNKPASTFNKNFEDEFFRNQNNLLQKEQLEDFSKTTSTLFAQSPSIKMEVTHDRHYTPVKQDGRNRDSPGVSFENNHSYSYTKESNHRTFSNLFIQDSRIFNQSNELFSKDGVIFKDSNYLVEENKHQKETIDNFQSEIIRLNMELREIKTNEQMLKRELQEKEIKTSLRQANKLQQKQLQWQLEQNGKLLEQIEKMQKQMKNKQQSNKLLEQISQQYQEEIKNKNKEIASLQQMQKQDQKQSDLIISILHGKINQFEKEIQKLTNTLSWELSEKERFEKLVDSQTRKLEDQGRSAEVDRSQINVLMMKLETYQTKYQQQLQVNAEQERNLKAETEERQKARLSWEEKNMKFVEERGKWTQRQRQISSQCNQLLLQKAQIKEKLIQVNRERSDLIQKLDEKSREQPQKILDLLQRNEFITSELQTNKAILDRIQKENQDKEAYILNLKQNSKRKDELYLKLNTKLQEKANELKNIQNKQETFQITYQKMMNDHEIQLKNQNQLVLHLNETLKTKNQQIYNMTNKFAHLQSTIKERQQQINKIYLFLKEKESYGQIQFHNSQKLVKDNQKLQQKLQQASTSQLESARKYKQLCQSIQKLEFEHMNLQKDHEELTNSYDENFQKISLLEEHLTTFKHKNELLSSQLTDFKQKYFKINQKNSEIQQQHLTLLNEFSNIKLKLEQTTQSRDNMAIYKQRYGSSEQQNSQLKKDCQSQKQLNQKFKETIVSKEEQLFHLNNLLIQQKEMKEKFKRQFDCERQEMNSILQQIGLLKANHEMEIAALKSQISELQKVKSQSSSQVLKIRQKYIDQEQESLNQIIKLKQTAQLSLDQHRQQIDTLMCIIDGSEQRYKHQVHSLQQKIKQLTIKAEKIQKSAKEQNNSAINNIRQTSQENSPIKEKQRGRKISSWSFIATPTKQKFKSVDPSDIQQSNADYIEVDREGLTYMCNLLNVQPEQGNLLNSLVIGLQKYAQMTHCSVKLAQNYRQLLQLFGIEEGETNQDAIIAQINGFRDNIQFLLERSRQQEEKSQRLIAHTRVLQGQLINESIRIAKMGEEIQNLNFLNQQLNNTIIQLGLRLSNGRRQVREAMLLAREEIEQKTLIRLSRAQSQQFVTVKSFGTLQKEVDEFELRG